MLGMDLRISFITLAVADLSRSLAFYADVLELPASGIVGTEFHDDISGADGTIVFLTPEGCPTIGLYERHNLARDAAVAEDSRSRTEFSLGIALPSREAVDALLAKVAQSGGTVTPSCHDRPWGVYSGYFTDPDGHLWEAVWSHSDTTNPAAANH